MPLCRTANKTNKKLFISLDVQERGFSVTRKKERIKQKTSIEVSIETKIPDPIIFRPITPTRLATQRIRGLRPSEEFLVEINGETLGVRYSGKEFTKTVSLIEGNNHFEIRLIRGAEKGNFIPLEIERDSIPPETKILVNDQELLSARIITQGTFDVSFASEDDHGPIVTYFKVNNGITQVFSDFFFIGEEGDYEIEYWSRDSLENEESHKYARLIIDRTPPSMPAIDIDQLPAKTRNLTINVSGINSEDTVRVEVNGVSADFIDNTHWTATVPLLEEGANILEAIAYDEAENASNPAIVSIVRDTIPPVRPGLITETLRTRASHMRVIGDQSSDTFRMTIDGTNNIVLSSPVRWYADVDFVEGPNTFRVEAYDDVDNVSLPLIFTIVRDTTPPPPPTVNPVISPTNNPIQLLTGGRSADTVKIIINNNGNLAQLGPGNTWFALVELTQEDLNDLHVQAEDDLGNRSGPTIVNIILDRVPPLPPTIDAIPFFTNQEDLLLQGDKTIDTVEVFENGSSVGISYPYPDRWNKNITLNLGLNNFEVRGRDFVGNISSASTAFIHYKPNPPFFTIAPYPPETIALTLTLSGTREALSFIKINNMNVGVTYPDGINGTLWEVPVALHVGQNEFIFKAVDQAGNESPEQIVEIERLLPILLQAFPIETVYAFGTENKGRVRVNGESPPVITSTNIRSYFIQGKKPKDINVVSNIGPVDMPGGTAGDSWQLIIPVSVLKRDVINIALQGRRLINPPEIVISNIYIVKSTFVGDLTLKIGGTIDVLIRQDAAIVITDYQFKNTPSPDPKEPLESFLDIIHII